MSEDIILKSFIAKSNYYRGLVLNEFITFEIVIEEIISNYFFNNDIMHPMGQQFKNIILNRMAFESKRSSLKYICDKISTENGFVKTVKNCYPHKALFSEIRLLNDQRNYFAHYLLLEPTLKNDAVIGLADFRDSPNLISYTKNEVYTLINRISKARRDIFDLVNSTSGDV